MRSLPGILHGSLAALALLLLAPCALAQLSGVAEIANYQGADREQRLIEGAKREKELTFYSSIPPDDISALVSAFDKKYGVKVKVWRADSEGFLQRILGEARARRFEVDVMAGSSSALEPLYRENLLQEVKSPKLAGIIPQAIAPHRQWVAVYLSTFVQAYNTELVRKDSLPKTYYDLLRPQWKDKLGIEAEDFDWFAQVVMDIGEAQGLRLGLYGPRVGGWAVPVGVGLAIQEIPNPHFRKQRDGQRKLLPRRSFQRVESTRAKKQPRSKANYGFSFTKGGSNVAD